MERKETLTGLWMIVCFLGILVSQGSGQILTLSPKYGYCTGDYQENLGEVVIQCFSDKGVPMTVSKKSFTNLYQGSCQAFVESELLALTQGKSDYLFIK